MSALLQALRRCWVRVLCLGLLGALVGFGVTWLVVPGRYTSSALMLVSSKPPRGSREGESDFANFQRTQAALLRSYAVLHGVLQKPEVAGLREVRAHHDPLAWLQKELVTDYLLGPEILRVTLSGDYPEDVAAVLNEVTRAYLREVASKDEARVAGRVKQLQESYRKSAEALREKRQKLLSRLEELGLDDPKTIEMRQGAIQQQVSAAQKERLAIRLNLKKAEVELAALQAQAKDPPAVTVPDPAVDEEMKQDLVVKKRLDRLVLLDETIQRIQNASAEHTRAAALRKPLAEQAALLEALDRLRKQARRGLEAKLRVKARADRADSIRKLESNLRLYKEQLAALDGEVKLLEGQADNLRAALRSPDKRTSDVEALRDDVAQTEIVLKKVGDELGTLQVGPPAAGRVSELEAAAVPLSRKTDRQLKLAGAAALGMLGLVVVGLTLLESRSHRVYAADDVVQGLGMSLVGTVPGLPPGARRATPTADAADGLDGPGGMTEAIDAIRTVLLHGPRGQGPRVVMVTSALGGEGKTTLASQLAASLARAWRKTLLIDCDLRNPAAHQLFDVPGEPGFCEGLRAPDLRALPGPVQAVRGPRDGAGTGASPGRPVHRVPAAAHPRADQSPVPALRAGPPNPLQIPSPLAPHAAPVVPLWNVLKGDMSLVGPRPERPEFVPHLERTIPSYGERLLVRPGVTGLAQVRKPPDTDLASVRLKLAYDLYYVRRPSQWLDLRLLAGTALKVVGVPPHVLGPLCGIPRKACVEHAYRLPAAEAKTVAACVGHG
jgi:hypothetical protein